MSHRLQVLLDPDEIAAISGVAEKPMLVREAAAHAYPTADPAEMEAEIARGCAEESP